MNSQVKKMQGGFAQETLNINSNNITIGIHQDSVLRSNQLAQ